MHQPDRGDSHSVQVVQAVHQPAEVAATVTVCVREGGHREAIENRILIPEIVNHLGTLKSFRRARAGE